MTKTKKAKGNPKGSPNLSIYNNRAAMIAFLCGIGFWPNPRATMEALRLAVKRAVRIANNAMGMKVIDIELPDSYETLCFPIHVIRGMSWERISNDMDRMDADPKPASAGIQFEADGRDRLGQNVVDIFTPASNGGNFFQDISALFADLF
jgi:hypothetical protein